jgi:hypothetical protein
VRKSPVRESRSETGQEDSIKKGGKNDAMLLGNFSPRQDSLLPLAPHWVLSQLNLDKSQFPILTNKPGREEYKTSENYCTFRSVVLLL